MGADSIHPAASLTVRPSVKLIVRRLVVSTARFILPVSMFMFFGASALMVLAFVTFEASGDAIDKQWVTVATLATFGLALAAKVTTWSLSRPAPTTDIPGTHTLPDVIALRFPDSLSPETLMLLDPRAVTPHITESVETEDGEVVHRVTKEFVLPKTDAPAEQTEMRVPLFRIQRDEVLHRLVVTDGSGARQPVLNATESRQEAARQIRDCAVLVFGPVAYMDRVQHHFDKILEAIRSPRPSELTESTELALRAIKQHPRPTGSPIAFGDWSALKARLIAVCEAALDTQIIFVPYSLEARRFVLEYSYRRVMGDTSKKFRDRCAHFLGVRPFHHLLAISEVGAAGSFHFYFKAPQEQYVHSCRLGPSPIDAGTRVHASLPLLTTAAIEELHVHLHAEPGASRATLPLRVSCWEKPPGLLGLVLIVAGTLATIIWTLGYYYGTVFDVPSASESATGSTGNTDLPAVLLAIPGLLAGWLASQFTSEKLRQTSLATVEGTLACGVVALGASLAAVLALKGLSPGPRMGAEHPIWTGLMLISAAVAADLAWKYWRRAAGFVRRRASKLQMREQVL